MDRFSGSELYDVSGRQVSSNIFKTVNLNQSCNIMLVKITLML